MNDTLRQRFDAGYTPEPNSGCWLWGKSVNKKGYGQISRSRKEGPALAHCVSWQLAKGEIPQGLCVLHRCDVPCCVNPDHLWLGTKADNNRDMAGKGRHYLQRKDHCPKGHRYYGFATEKQRICRTCKNIYQQKSRDQKKEN